MVIWTALGQKPARETVMGWSNFGQNTLNEIRALKKKKKKKAGINQEKSYLL